MGVNCEGLSVVKQRTSGIKNAQSLYSTLLIISREKPNHFRAEKTQALEQQALMWNFIHVEVILSADTCGTDNSKHDGSKDDIIINNDNIIIDNNSTAVLLIRHAG